MFITLGGPGRPLGDPWKPLGALWGYYYCYFIIYYYYPWKPLGALWGYVCGCSIAIFYYFRPASVERIIYYYYLLIHIFRFLFWFKRVVGAVGVAS